jgi:hypothetical protein
VLKGSWSDSVTGLLAPRINDLCADGATTVYYAIDTRFIPCGSATPVNDSVAAAFEKRKYEDNVRAATSFPIALSVSASALAGTDFHQRLCSMSVQVRRYLPSTVLSRYGSNHFTDNS